jgi:hypothetical protein
MIKPEDAKNVDIYIESLTASNGEIVASILNQCLDDPLARAALVRELIAGGHCSPSVWALACMDMPEVFSLHEDEAEAQMAGVHVRNAKVKHWKGQPL